MNKRKIKLKESIFVALVIILSSAPLITAAPPQHGYNSQILWTRTVTDGNYDHTWGGKVATDSNNNVITWINSAATGESDLLKYSPDNNLIWEITVNINGATNILVDSGQIGIIPPQNTSPQIMYLNTLITPGYHLQDIETDSQNNIIIVIDHLVQSSNPQINVVNVFKYDQNGNELWKKGYTSYTNYLIPGYDSAIDSSNNIYVPCMSYFFGGLMKLTSDGNLAWFRLVKILPFWFPLSVALDSNQNPIVSSVDLLTNPSSPTIPIGFTKFDSNTGIKISNTAINMLLQATTFNEAALTVDLSDNSVFFGFLGYVHKIDSSLQNIVWSVQYPFFINDLKADDQKLVACGGVCTLGGVYNFYAAILGKTSGATLLNMALGPLLYCTNPNFGPYWNQLEGMAKDTQGNFLFSGGGGGLIIVKVLITYTP